MPGTTGTGHPAFSAGTLPLCLWDFENKFKKGDNIILTAFGAGFAWGAIYVKWGYDGRKK